ncbi:tRNA (adenosine(37)-N6)-threonylcarbamoyltransferase complex transferase subunit TsaD [Candidatus Trichorickettsia mobilis]|uniref:tRNA (adenosine(37)-N6)-threonylcarbamoyltransferase complex transferase subunit TsaD n=1 Tax=Candidatus Trichorickettsia mobilis TaxID=1346319 RepID=UPI00292D5F63|nr:tRNA (adenosine(37)-N6)-threonylcarbamoyltransferase complex transferase subunit TsaD [Candidatus Trichorickettsia mobilis]
MIKILGIESSCDDTGVAVVAAPRQILSNIVISQNSEHAPFCGVVPEIAARKHLQNLEYAVQAALAEAKLNIENIDAIAATSGPGLIGGVIVGSMFGRALASSLSKPFIAVNHLEGHALTARLSHGIPYPYLLLLVSGGHCQFVEVHALGCYKILGRTIDDAVGEAFDKVAKMLGLPFPGGPEIEKLAKLGDPHKYTLPKPIINQNNCDMSFSGLKTAVRTLLPSLDLQSQQTINDLAASFQYTVGEILSKKLAKAIALYQPLSNTSKTIVIAGGVAANQYINNILRESAAKVDYMLVAPPIKLCTDNAAMIAYAGLERFNAGLTNGKDFCPRARWSLEELSA